MRPTPTSPALSSAPGPVSRRPWLDHWLESCRDLAELKASHPMVDAVIDEIDGRMIRVGDQWLADFASCNYLGFDLDREIIDAIPAYLDAWGTHPSWSRLLGSPVLYEQIEERLTALIGSEDSLVLPTITHIHLSVIPLLAASGTIFLDARAHKTIYDGCQAARARGAAVRRFRFEDPDHLDELLTAERDPTRLVCMDGVNSMTGNPPDLPAFAAVSPQARRAALRRRRPRLRRHRRARRGHHQPLWVARQHIVRHFDESYDNLILVGGFSKSYSSLLAFIACPTRGQGPAEGRGPAVPLLGSVAGRLAGHRARRPGGQRPARRRAARRARAADAPRRSTGSSAWTSSRPTARACRSSRSRCATTARSTRSVASSSSAAST